MKTSLSNTFIGHSSKVDDYAKNARKFLIDNVHRITLVRDEEQRILKTHDLMTRTLMSDLYQQAIDEYKTDIFKPLILDKIDKVPSWFLISWLDIDTLELRNTDKSSAEILNSISEYRDKILVDITPYYSQKRRAITDTTSYYSRMIRAMLNRSYVTSERMWLTPNLIYMLTKFYVMILSSKIGRIYNLTYQEQFIAATALAVFFVNKCTEDTHTVNPMMGKMDFLRRNVDTAPIYEYIEEHYTVVSYDLEAVVKVITEFGPSRLSNFNHSTLYSMNATLTSNQIISLIALEFPPYFCHLIISALSGDKSSIYHTLKSLNMRKDTLEFQAELMKTRSFIRSL